LTFSGSSGLAARKIFAVVLVLGAGGCGGQIYYPVPAQRTARKHDLEMMLDATPGRPWEKWGAILSGVRTDSAPGANWRWAGAESTYTIQPPDFAGWSLVAHVTAAESVLQKVGPQRISFDVNGKIVGSALLTKSQKYDFRYPLDDNSLRNVGRATMRMTVSPCVPAGSGREYCVLLHSIGLMREAR
jgi:hypothetical protein